MTFRTDDELERSAPGLKNLLVAGASVFALALTPAVAQDTSSGDDVELIEEADDDEEDGDAITVTGSRIKRDTFSSLSPLQVITTDASLDVGLIDPSQILQQSEAAAGQQIDATFQGFVLDNGPGSQTLNLRGLGADRTLLLINGRRFAPIGVEGAPSNPSINLLPSSLIEQYDLLLDGASSVYGSDAVAGVGNVILRNDFEGLELFASGDYNEEGAGNDYTLSAAWGKNTDRGFFGVGAEYDYRDEITFADRDFLAGCNTEYEITDSGEIRTVNVRDRLIIEDRTPGVTLPDSPCKVQGLVGRVFLPFQAYGSVYYTDGPGNSGIPNFNESTFGVDIDADGDGIRDVNFRDRDVNGDNLDTSFISEQERISLMSYGQYTFDGEMNITPFYEAMFVQVNVNSDSGQPQLFPAVPLNNPFNPCATGFDFINGVVIDNPGAVDCAGAEATLGVAGVNSGLALPVLPIVSVTGDRDNTDVTLEQMRFVAGVGGDLPFMSTDNRFLQLSDWSFEVSAVYSEGTGSSIREGVREDALAIALGIDPSTDPDGNGIADDYEAQDYFMPLLAGGACDIDGLANPDLIDDSLKTGCVPVNMFAPSLLLNPVGDFATQAERDYVFGERIVDTTYTQTVVNGFITGNLFTLPAGEVGAVAGFEWRRDEIDSRPNDVAENGLFFGFFSDQGANGEKDIMEAFFELDVPILANQPLAKQLDFNASARWTEEEFYGAAWTYSLKAGWRPVDPLLLKASFGTSFRAPNLRENFLGGTTGFVTIFDPCAVPDDAIVTGTYNAADDDRAPEVLRNCIREGRDPTTVGFDSAIGNTFQTSSTEVSTGGSLDLEEETSESFTVGAAFEQPWFDAFDLTLNVSYVDIEVENAVVEPSSQFIVNDCFFRVEETRSPFCGRIQYGADDTGDRGLINFITAGFINQDKETYTGLDYNMVFNTEFDAFGQPFDFGVNVRANQLTERNNVFVDDLGVELLDEDLGEFGFPEWTSTTTFTLGFSDYLISWQTRYVGEVDAEANVAEEDKTQFSDAFDSLGTGFISQTCAGADFGDVLCKDVNFAEGWAEHALALRYRGDTWTIRGGITNLFDTAPPLVDTASVFGISNTPIGNPYNFNGRQYFLSVQKQF